LPILGVIAHTVVNTQLQEYVLALREIQGRHTGENIAPVVLDILQDYGITYKLGYIQMDNATNNDTLIAALSSSKPTPYYYYTNHYTNHYTKAFLIIMTLLNTEYAALAIFLIL
jgi:hypothetical protein